ncbi:peptide-methionine (R)-S-oxide reductase MsrB [Sphingomicrobium arenosum]|uniref:peptide-methionine (R)-S-oxide reductase MsrB n=1 Tax=Sphingomicrobium arenosum TaxID=2233861 RepID=UPI002241038A|nr:peptide-methionine (R)-S-oxide reductase MsrB [Sphingomicrobium arenosum]
MADKHLTDAEWRDRLTPEQYRILREGGTEPPFSGALNDEKRPGTFRCAACGEELFKSGAKYNSGSGWPSFTAPAEGDAVDEHRDSSHGMERVEIRCSACDSHLGHVFPDGPGPTGLRYCVNSASLDFTPEDDGDA